jgi:hypothetical protein
VHSFVRLQDMHDDIRRTIAASFLDRELALNESGFFLWCRVEADNTTKRLSVGLKEATVMIRLLVTQFVRTRLLQTL